MTQETYRDGETVLATTEYVLNPDALNHYNERALVFTDAPAVVRWDHGGTYVAIQVQVAPGICLDFYAHRMCLRYPDGGEA